MNNKFTLFAAVIALTACSTSEEHNKTESTPTKDSTLSLKPFIDPPFKSIDPQFEKFSFDAEKGDTLFPGSGSIILFPANSLVDANGELVKGKVDVRYREFSDPVDFFVSGIPMDYEMNGEKLMFESSGMMELTVTSQNKPVFVNPDHKPEVNLATSNTDPEHNLYYLDTVQRKWVEKGKDVITETTRSMGKNNFERRAMPVADMEKPEKPIQASGDQPVFEVEIDPAAMPELMTYNNLKFEIDKSDKTFNPKDAEVEWTEVKAEKSSKKGLYKVTFTRGNRKVSYLTRPVLEGKDYDAALKQFEIKNKQYEALVNTRLKKEKEENEKAQEIEKQQKARLEENERIVKLNVLIEARNKEIAASNAITIGKNKETEKNNTAIAEGNERKRAEAKKSQEESFMDKARKEMENARKVRILADLIKAKDPKANSYSATEREEALRFIEEEKAEAIRQAEFMKRVERVSELVILIRNNDPKANSYDEGEREAAMQLIQQGRDAATQQTVFRSFELSGFGFYNCDRPSRPGEQVIAATFVNENGEKLILDAISVVYEGFNGVTTSGADNLRIKPGSNNLLFAFSAGKLAYLTYEDYRTYNITRSAKEQTFNMRIYPNEIRSPEEIRRLLGIRTGKARF